MKHHLKKVAVVAAISALSSFGVQAINQAAQADTPDCVSKKEFLAVKEGMRKPHVNGIFDTRGRENKEYASATFEVRTYRTCPAMKNNVVQVAYHEGHLSNKTRGRWIM